MMINKLLCVIVLCFVYDGSTVVVGDSCDYNGFRGVCVPYERCRSTQLMKMLLLKGKIKFCDGRQKKNMIICCLDPFINKIPLVSPFAYLANVITSVLPSPKKTPSHTIYPTTRTGTIPSTTSTSSTTAGPVATTPLPRPSTTEYMPPVYDYVTNEPIFDGCRELDPKLTANKTGQKAWDKCIEYQEQLVYPCQRSVALLGNMVRVTNCAHADQSTDGTARPNEFPHMVVVGVRRAPEETLQWACTGTLISERFILTSAHCWAQHKKEHVLYATMGNLQRMAGHDDIYQEHKIESITFYTPDDGFLKDEHLYHDIALLKTATVIRLNQWVVPACLDLSGKHSRAVSARWRARSWNKTNGVQKVILHELRNEEYQKKFPSSTWQYKVAHQIGYESYVHSSDNCKFHNEVSLTAENQWVHCMHTVVGVLSYIGATCVPSPAGSYTRVIDYASWIEQIVWPDTA